MPISTYDKVISGKADYNIKFIDFQKLLTDLHFELKRQKGSHMIYYREDISAFMNIQRDGAKAKGYEVKQLREIILKYGL